MTPSVAAISRFLLVSRDEAPRTGMDAKIRHYRLARLAVAGPAPRRDPLAHVKRMYD